MLDVNRMLQECPALTSLAMEIVRRTPQQENEGHKQLSLVFTALTVGLNIERLSTPTGLAMIRSEMEAINEGFADFQRRN